MLSALKTFYNVLFKIPDLKKKVWFTIALLVIYRMGFQIPIPFLDQSKFAAAAEKQSQEGTPLGQIAEYLQMFSGGTLSKSSLFGLGIMPYISASIILMLLGEVWGPLRKLRQEGAAGHKKIQEYTRYLTVPLCIIQAFMIMVMFKNTGSIYPDRQVLGMTMGVVAMTAGTLFLMWLGEQIDEYGIGNGISLLIMAGIVSRFPWAVKFVYDMHDFSVDAAPEKYGLGTVLFLVAAFVFVIAGAILITQGQRRIPIQQAKQMRGRRMFGGQRHYLPLRINHGGVMPIIFASSLMMFPPIIIEQIGKIKALRGSGFIATLRDAFSHSSFTYNFVFIVMIFLFAYFWTTVQFQPKEMAKRLRDNGSFIPGLRPGHRTAEYLETVMIRITYFGASFLAFIAVVPSVVSQLLGVDYRVAMFLGGTGLLIVVSVSLDLVQKIEANLIMRNYEGFSESGRIKGSR